ncbi:hypothetical protein FACS189418_5620 [Clostridia bacterium]|nr:hypothetical protein FACS189418_5620 [Clostridia bacterium]
MAHSYLVAGAPLKCVAGSCTGKLSLPKSHGIYVKGDALCNEDDTKPILNIPSFGVCSITGKPCTPMPVPKWMAAKKTTKIDGKSAITTDSGLFCLCGALILPESSGQKEVMALLASLPEEERRKLLNGIKTCSPYSKDPVNLCTGNLTMTKEDLRIEGLYPLPFHRTYNSLETRVGQIGKGWIHNFEVRLTEYDDRIEIVQPDSRIETYWKAEEGRLKAATGILSHLRKEGKEYLLETPKFTQYRFNEAGQCLSIVELSGYREEFFYQEGKLVEAKNPCGSMHFFYHADGFLREISDGFGKFVRFFYNKNGQLSFTKNALGYGESYTYSEEGWLTEIFNASGESTLNNEYDVLGRVVKQIFPDGGVMTYEYTDQSQKTVMVEQNGNRTRYYRDERFRNIRVADSEGSEIREYNEQDQVILYRDKNKQETRFTYDEQGNAVECINALGEKAYKEFNALGQLTKETFFDGSSVTLTYNQKVQLETKTDEVGNTIRYTYTGNGLLERIRFPDGSSQHYRYDEKNRLVALTNPNGSIHQFEHNEQNQVIAVIDALGNRLALDYDAMGQCLSVCNAEGNTREFTYNPQGLVEQVKDFHGGITKQEFNPLNRVTSYLNALEEETKFIYDPMWNVKEQIAPNGAVTKWDYDRKNRLVKSTNALGASVAYEYDPNGNLVKEIGPNGEEYVIEYDALDRKIKEIDPEGRETTFTYDSRDRLIEVVDASGNRWKTEYYPNGKVKSQTNPLGECTQFVYNALSLLTEQIDPDGAKTTYEYFPGGLLKKVQFFNGNFFLYEYDENNNIRCRKDQSGYEVLYHYDALNRITEIKDSLDAKKSYTYTPLGQVASVSDSLGNTTHYRYSLTGKLLQVENALGVVVSCHYDESGSLLQVEYPADPKSNLADLPNDRSKNPFFNGNPLKEQLEAETLKQDPAQPLFVEYQRNLLGQVTSAKDALGQEEKWVYGTNGKLFQQIDKEGYLTEYSYTKSGELEEIRYPNHTSVKMQYNPNKELIGFCDALGEHHIERDPLGRITAVTDYQGEKVAYEWTSANLLKRLIYPDETTVEYSYDSARRLVKWKEGEQVTRYAYDPNNRIQEKQLPKGIKAQYTYLPNGQLKALSYYQSEQMLESLSYGYDLEQNVIQKTHHRHGLEEQSGTFHYAYDALHRLTEVKKNGQALRKYTYDLHNNRTSLWENHRLGDSLFTSQVANERDHGAEAIQYYAYNEANQLTHSTGFQGENVYQYDKRGNLIRKWKDEQLILAHDYDQRNHLLYAWNKAIKSSVSPEEQLTQDQETNVTRQVQAKMAKYTYNGLGYLTEKEVGRENPHELTRVYYDPDVESYVGRMDHVFQQDPQKKVHYLWDMGKKCRNLLAVQQGESKKRYIWDEESTAVLCKEDAFSYQTLLQDELGTVMRSVGKQETSYAYDEFGNDLFPHQKKAQDFGFTGYLFDEQSVLNFAQARYYDPESGRFGGVDPLKGSLADMQTLNYYGYCQGNPLKYVDPTGEFTYLEGIEAHGILEADTKVRLGNQVEVEKFISPYLGSPFKWGFADIVYYDNGGAANVYEIKPITQRKSPSRNHNGLTPTQQRESYENGLRAMNPNIQINPRPAPLPGFMYNPTNNTWQRDLFCPSKALEGKNLRYYVYEDQPGLIYYGYVNQPKPAPQPVVVEAKEKKTASGWQKAQYVVGGCALILAAGALFLDDATGIGVADDPVAVGFVAKAIQLFSRVLSPAY